MTTPSQPGSGYPPEVKEAFRKYILEVGISQTTLRRFRRTTKNSPAHRTLNRWALEFRSDPEVRADMVAHAAATASAVSERKESVTASIMRRTKRLESIADDASATENPLAIVGAMNALVRIRDSLVAEEQAIAKAGIDAPDSEAKKPTEIRILYADAPTPSKPADGE